MCRHLLLNRGCGMHSLWLWMLPSAPRVLGLCGRESQKTTKLRYTSFLSSAPPPPKTPILPRGSPRDPQSVIPVVSGLATRENVRRRRGIHASRTNSTNWQSGIYTSRPGLSFFVSRQIRTGMIILIQGVVVFFPRQHFLRIAPHPRRHPRRPQSIPYNCDTVDPEYATWHSSSGVKLY